MLQTGQFPKLSTIFFDDMDLLKKFVNPNNYNLLNMSTGVATKMGQFLTDCDPEINKKQFIIMALHCARVLKKDAAVRLLEQHCRVTVAEDRG